MSSWPPGLLIGASGGGTSQARVFETWGSMWANWDSPSPNPTVARGHGRERGLLEGPPWRLEWVLPERPTLVPVCLSSSQTALTTGWWVQTWHSHCAWWTNCYDYINYYAKNCWPDFELSPHSDDDDDDDSWRLHNPSSRESGRQLGGPGKGRWDRLCQLQAAAVASPLGPPILGLPSSNKLFLLVHLCHSLGEQPRE